MSDEAAIALGSALLGAVVGGMASLVASLIVDRWRTRREMRIRIYEDLLNDAVGAAARRCRLARERLIPGEAEDGLEAVARLRRAAVIAGKHDVSMIRGWLDDYARLADLDIEFAKARKRSDGPPETMAPPFQEAETASLRVLHGLYEYSKWLESRLGGHLAGPVFPDEGDL